MTFQVPIEHWETHTWWLSCILVVWYTHIGADCDPRFYIQFMKQMLCHSQRGIYIYINVISWKLLLPNYEWLYLWCGPVMLPRFSMFILHNYEKKKIRKVKRGFICQIMYFIYNICEHTHSQMSEVAEIVFFKALHQVDLHLSNCAMNRTTIKCIELRWFAIVCAFSLRFSSDLLLDFDSINIHCHFYIVVGVWSCVCHMISLNRLYLKNHRACVVYL